jgi:hypothetical protein
MLSLLARLADLEGNVLEREDPAKIGPEKN